MDPSFPHLEMQARVLAKLSVRHAEKDRAVIAARKKVGRMLSESAVSHWTNQNREGPPPEDGKWSMIAIATSNGGLNRKCGNGSLAASVGNLGKALEDRYRWNAGHGALWLLTGELPEIEMFRVEVNPRSAWPRAGRIVMTLDPSLTPAEVQQLYQAAREGLTAQKKIRPVEPKNLAVLECALDHPTLSARELWRYWNATMGHIKTYSTQRNLDRDIKATADRLSRGALRGFYDLLRGHRKP